MSSYKAMNYNINFKQKMISIFIMELTYAELTSPGPARENNEDFHGFWQPESLAEKRSRGAVALLADGVGGMHHGEVASRLAVETALKAFRDTAEGQTPQQLLTHMFKHANLAVYDKAMEDHGKFRMATTLNIVVFRDNEITVGNVGDSRVYLIHKAEIKQLSTDHTYIGMQQKLGLISEQEAKISENRNVLTRSIGQEPIIRVDVEKIEVLKGDKMCFVRMDCIATLPTARLPTSHRAFLRHRRAVN